MSQAILGGDVTVHFLDENRQKRVAWTGAAAGTRSANEVYSALQDLFDEPGQMDDGTPMSAQTPVEYTVGIIDSGDLEPWYFTYDLMEHLTGGAVRTASWTRTPTSATGIVMVPCSATTFTATDIGATITHAVDTDSGTLLEIIDDGGATIYLAIRPASSAAANNFDSASGTLNSSASANTATQSGASTTGEMIWANCYSIGTIEPDTHIYFYQGAASADNTRVRVFSVNDNTQDWWGDGHIDILLPIRDFTTSGNPIIDSGFATVLARKSTTEYASFEVQTSTTSGGRNPVPLGTKSDLNNTTGYASITTTAVSVDDFAVGDEITGVTSGARAIITQIDGASPTYTFHYYLIDDPLTDFQTAAETITNNDGTGSATKNASAPSAQGPALASWFTNAAAPSTAFGNTTFDIDDDGTAEWYGITINCNNNPLSEVYEWLKYITRRGATATTNTDGIPGELYIGGEVYLKYSGAVTGTIAEGSDVTQETSGATGVVISHDTTNKVILLRSTRGTFFTNATTATLTDNDTAGTVEIDTAAETFAASVVSPFGTFAGGTFFGARGVLLSNWIAANENSFQLTPINGGTKVRPTAISLEVTNLVGGAETLTTSDTVAVWRLTGAGGTINKTEYSAAGGEVPGAATLVVDTAIAVDVPGKTTGGTLVLRDASDNNASYYLRYSSWTGSTFTLANIVIAAADAGTNTTTIVEAGAFTNAKRGDLVWNSTRSAVSYVTSVDSVNQVTIAPAIAGQTTLDVIELNAVPITVNTLDDVYVALMSRYATGVSESVSIVFSSTINYRVVVRNNRNATKILPFTTDDSTAGTNRSVATIRNTDTITT